MKVGKNSTHEMPIFRIEAVQNPYNKLSLPENVYERVPTGNNVLKEDPYNSLPESVYEGVIEHSAPTGSRESYEHTYDELSHQENVYEEYYTATQVQFISLQLQALYTDREHKRFY